MSDNDAVVAKALQVAAVVFGGVESTGPQWERCLQAARLCVESHSVPPTAMQKYTAEQARGCFERCAEFNKKNPIGTAGVLLRPAGAVQTTLDQPALVFPIALRGEVVMAWFRDVGWCETNFFVPKAQVVTVADDLQTMAFNMKGNNKGDLALALFQALVKEDPKRYHGWNEIGVYHQSKQEWERAIDAYTMAITAKPDLGEALNNRGMAYRAIGKPKEALDDCLAAQKLLPESELISLNTASTLDDMDRVDECLEILDARIVRRPNDFNTRYNRSIILLSVGRMKEGWTEFEARLHQPLVNSHYEHYDAPRWNGDDVEGKNILVWAEQGIGDEILTASMIPELISIASSVTLLCTDRLVPLFKRSFPGVIVDHRPTATVVESFMREKLRPELMPAAAREVKFDFQMSQRDLGMMFRNNLNTFWPSKAFLMVGKPFLQGYRSPPFQRKVGITWHSRGNKNVGKLKGMDLWTLAPFLKTPGVTFVNLQYGDCSEELNDLRANGYEIEDCPVDPLVDMDGYASLVASMDLVITASNTTAHVAGALGVPCWVMVPEGPGRLWYWFRHREDSPWYPSLRLFRQPAAAHWAPVVTRICKELAYWAKA